MAKGRPQEDDEDDEVAAPKKGKLKLIILILLVVALLGGGGGFAYWFFAIHGKDNQGAKAAAQAKPDAPPTYTALDPPFTVNLKDPGVALQAAITLKVHDEDVDTAIKA
ncbi:MAG: flagellar basal body-associated FliL family protein, partial [Burkholderiales bacterium]